MGRRAQFPSRRARSANDVRGQDLSDRRLGAGSPIALHHPDHSRWRTGAGFVPLHPTQREVQTLSVGPAEWRNRSFSRTGVGGFTEN